MKRHLCNLWFDLPDGRALAFVGYVTTRVISPRRLFLTVFGFDLPDGSTFSQFKPAFSNGQ